MAQQKTPDQLKEEISQAWRHIQQCAGHDTTSDSTYTAKPEEAQKIGQWFFDYMTATINDVDWEGYPDHEFEGIKSFVTDLSYFVQGTLD